MTFAKRLAASMSRAGKSRRELADTLGVSPQAIGMILMSAGGKERSFNAERTFLAAQFLGVNPHWLATGEGEMLGKSYTLEAQAGQYDLKEMPMPADPSKVDLVLINLRLLLASLPPDRLDAAHGALVAALVPYLQDKRIL